MSKVRALQLTMPRSNNLEPFIKTEQKKKKNYYR